MRASRRASGRARGLKPAELGIAGRDTSQRHSDNVRVAVRSLPQNGTVRSDTSAEPGRGSTGPLPEGTGRVDAAAEDAEAPSSQ